MKKGKSCIREELNQIKSTTSSNEIKIQMIINRNIRSQMFFKIGVLKNFAIFTEKHLFSCEYRTEQLQ